jgi:hypothetical protein
VFPARHSPELAEGAKAAAAFYLLRALSVSLIIGAQHSSKAGFADFCPELKIRSVYAADPNAEAWGVCGRGRVKKQVRLFF